jgi:hypothetical protein
VTDHRDELPASAGGGPLAPWVSFNDQEGSVSFETKMRITGASLATLVVGIAAVWLVGDPRAFGLVVLAAGIAAARIAARHEQQHSISAHRR